MYRVILGLLLLSLAPFSSWALERFVPEDTNLSMSDLRYQDFSLQQINKGLFRGAYLFNASFEKCDLQEASFESAQMTLANLKRADLTRSNLSKANLTKGMATDWAKYGLNCNAIAPGYFDTPLNAALVSDPDFSAWLEKRTPAGRWGKVDELVGACVFLSSDASSFVNGHVLFVDGGITASL